MFPCRSNTAPLLARHGRVIGCLLIGLVVAYGSSEAQARCGNHVILLDDRGVPLPFDASPGSSAELPELSAMLRRAFEDEPTSESESPLRCRGLTCRRSSPEGISVPRGGGDERRESSGNEAVANRDPDAEPRAGTIASERNSLLSTGVARRIWRPPQAAR